MTVSVLALLAGGAPAASAGPASGPLIVSRTRSMPPVAASLPGADAEVARVQQNLHKVAAAVRAAVAKATTSGFSGIIISPKTDEISVYWHGALPNGLSVRFSSAAADQGATLHIRPAAYSKQELDSALARLADPALRFRGLVSYGSRPDGSGIDVGASADLQLPDLGVRTFVDRGVKPAVPLIGRWDDIPAYFGGDVYAWENHDGTDGFCSGGFGVREAKENGFYLMLTAAHCFFDGLYQTPTEHEDYGFYFNKVDEEDTMVIDTLGPHTTTHWIYTGDADVSGVGIGETRSLVASSSTTEVGDLLCTSGGFSGERCGLEVTAVDVTRDGIRHLHRLEQVAGLNAAGEGDSGGPVYARLPQPPPPGTQSLVEARATITSGDPTTQVSCTGYAPPERRCFWRIFVSDLPTAMERYATIVNT